MEIANPIYYATFNYLMQDNRAARLLVGRIAGLEVESLEPRPLELETPREATRWRGADVDQPPVALFRMNFTARVRTAGGGERHVAIEIQKTNAPTSVERFRVWLGGQPRGAANVEHPSGRHPSSPVVTIYLLGYDLEIADEPVLDVFPRVTARRTGAEIDADHPFIAGIDHRSHIVQIPLLRGRRRDDLERVLSIFDQGEARIEHAPALMLTIDRSAYPAAYDFVPRRLHRAASETEVPVRVPEPGPQRPGAIFDGQTVALECPSCSHCPTETVGALTYRRTLVCDGCGASVDIDGRALGLSLGAQQLLDALWRDAAGPEIRILVGAR